MHFLQNPGRQIEREEQVRDNLPKIFKHLPNDSRWDKKIHRKEKYVVWIGMLDCRYRRNYPVRMSKDK